MVLAATPLTSDASGTDASSYTTESISPAANSLLVVFVSSARSTLTAPTVAVSGLSLTWTTQADLLFAASNVRRVFMATAPCGATPGSGAITITHDATSLVTSWAVIEVTGQHASTPVVQTVTNSGGTGTASSGTVTLAAAGHTNNRPISFFYHRGNEVTTPRTNWTELSDNAAAAPIAGSETQWRSDAFETTASASWATAGNWAGIATEIAAATAGGAVALDGATTAAATPTAALALEQALTASITTASTPTAVLAVDQALTGTTTATAAPTGALITALALAGQTAAVASTAASLDIEQALTATTAAVSSTTANLGLDQPLTGVTGAAATLAGELAVARGLDGAVTAASSLTGVLTGALEAVALTAAYDNTDASSYTTASISPAANSLLVVFVYSAGTLIAPTSNTVSGLGLTWTERADVTYSGGSRRVTMLTAQCGANPGSGALTITSPSSIGDAWSVIEVTSHNQSNPVEQIVTVASATTDTSGTIVLASSAHPANRPVSAWATRSNAGITPRFAWTELSDTPGAAPNAGFETQWRDADTPTASATWTGASLYAGIAAELNAAITAGTVTLNGATSGTAAPAGILAVGRALTGAVSATSTLTGELAGTSAFGGDTEATSTLTGALSIEQALTGTTSAAAAPAGELGVAQGLTGAVVSAAAPAGDLDAGVGLAGATTAAATLTGAVARTLSLVGATAATATLTGETGVAVALDGGTEAASTLTVTTLVRDSDLVGAPIVATSTVAGTKFELSLGLYGTVTSAATVAGVMRVVDTLPHLVGPVTAAVVNTELAAAVVTDAAIEVSVPR